MSSFIHRQQSCRRFEFQDICTATENFDESLVIGSGGFGIVYKGNLTIGSSHDVVAIKRLNPKSTHDEKEFPDEVCTISMLCHRNIVSLFGYCSHEKKDNILVSEYMSNGTLNDHLHKYNTRLSWLQRLKICIGIARGLCYLHNDTNIIHGYISSSKVLLHQNWEAKLSNFGLGRTCSRYQSSTYVNTCVIDNFGYLDPIYFETGKLSKKSDVYNFGVLMLEVLCRKPVVGEVFYGEGRNLVKWAQISIKAGKSRDLVDSGIRCELSLKYLKKFVSIAEKCLHEDLKLRPTMAEVVANLKDVLALQEKFNHSWLGGFISFSSYSKKLSHLFPHIKLIEILTSNFDQTSIMSEDYKVVYPCNSFRSTPHNNMFLEMKEVRADTKSPSPSPSVKEFMFDDLVRATRGFHLDVLVGEGGFEKVFLGWVNQDTLAPSKHGDGINVAVKRLDARSSQAHDEWMAQVNILGHLAHPNIIRLLGYCKYERELLLVYEYMPHLSFDRLLFKDDIAEPLSWRTRLLIMIRVARGLTYLHSRKIIVRDLKSSNILLDEAFNAKLGSFGFAKYGPETHVNASVKGTTLGYIAPEYFHTGCLTVESDIYSFGLVLLGTMTGRKPVDNKQSETEELNVKEIMDPRLGGNYPLEGASRCFKLALRCVERNPKDRPSGEEVLQGLELIHTY